MSSSCWQLRLRLEGGKHVLLEGVSPTATFGELKTRIRTQLKVTNAQHTLLVGFPPRPLSLDHNAAIAPAIHNHDTIVVVTTSTSSSLAVAPSSSSPSTSDLPSICLSSPPRRATRASTRASSRKEIQDTQVEETGTDRKRPRNSKSAQSKTSRNKKSKKTRVLSGSGPGANIQTLGGLAKRASKKKPVKRNVRIPKARRKKAAAKGEAADRPQDPKDNLGSMLASAASTPVSQMDSALKSLRKCMQTERLNREEEGLAHGRVSSCLTKGYTFTELDGYSLVDGKSQNFRVRFKRDPTSTGKADKHWVDEEHMIITAPLLSAVLRTLAAEASKSPVAVATSAQEGDLTMVTLKQDLPPALLNLQARNMAQRSPRVFWNLVRLYGPDIRIGLAELVPEYDWSFMDRRSRVLSDKAAENKRQRLVSAADTSKKERRLGLLRAAMQPDEQVDGGLDAVGEDSTECDKRDHKGGNKEEEDEAKGGVEPEPVEVQPELAGKAEPVEVKPELVGKAEPVEDVPSGKSTAPPPDMRAQMLERAKRFAAKMRRF